MKYRSITLNGNKNYRFSLIKYTDKYKEHLEDLKRMNSELANLIEELPKAYDELSEYQSYMILCNEAFCAGAIYIEPSCDKKDLKIKIQFIENCFNTKRSILNFVERIVDSLGLYFFDKENIEINLINNVDLSQFNKFKYRKRVYGENLTTYTCKNEWNNILPKLITEITETEKNLISWKQSWMQKFCNYHDLSSVIDKQLINEYDKGTISLQELFYKIESLLWVNINSINSTRMVSFSRNGKIKFDKSSNKSEGINYEFSYHILNDNFNFKTANFLGKESLQISSDSYSTNIKLGI